MALKTTTTGATATFRRETRRKETIASCWFSGLNVKVYDSITETVETYDGFDETAAKELAEANFSSDMSDYNIRSSSTAPFSWMRCPAANGTIKRSEAVRQGNSRMFSVVVTTETHTCSNSAGWSTYTP